MFFSEQFIDQKYINNNKIVKCSDYFIKNIYKSVFFPIHIIFTKIRNYITKSYMYPLNILKKTGIIDEHNLSKTIKFRW